MSERKVLKTVISRSPAAQAVAVSIPMKSGRSFLRNLLVPKASQWENDRNCLSFRTKSRIKSEFEKKYFLQCSICNSLKIGTSVPFQPSAPARPGFGRLVLHWLIAGLQRQFFLIKLALYFYCLYISYVQTKGREESAVYCSK